MKGLALVLLALAAGLAQAARVDGRVTQVVDGDTVWFAPAAGGKPFAVRLVGIDAPEICQEGGPEARQALAELVAGQGLHLRVQGGRGRLDDYGRTLATLHAGEQDLNRRMVEEGQAWSARYRWDRGPYVAQENMARALRRGLHRGTPQLPRDFRRSHGRCESALPVAVPDARPPAATAPRPAVPAADPAGYRCDGRTRCSQMRSCDEARHFLLHCPGVKLDGDGNGVPCEQQWCGRP